MTADASHPSMYDCWLGYRPLAAVALTADERDLLSRVAAAGVSPVLRTAREELVRGLAALTGSEPLPVSGQSEQPHVLIAAPGSAAAEVAWAAAGLRRPSRQARPRSSRSLRLPRPEGRAGW